MTTKKKAPQQQQKQCHSKIRTNIASKYLLNDINEAMYKDYLINYSLNKQTYKLKKNIQKKIRIRKAVVSEVLRGYSKVPKNLIKNSFSLIKTHYYLSRWELTPMAQRTEQPNYPRLIKTIGL